MTDTCNYHVSIIRNIPYIDPHSPQYVGHKHQLDVYRPVSEGNELTQFSSSPELPGLDSLLVPFSGFPTIIFFHGGGWIQGDRTDPKPAQLCAALARKGYVVVAPSYRLGSFVQQNLIWALLVPIFASVFYLIQAIQSEAHTWSKTMETLFWGLFLIFCIGYMLFLDFTTPRVSYTWPTQAEDAASASQWTMDHLHPSFLILSGHSAGAHLASTLAFNGEWSIRPHVRALVALSGPYAISSTENNGLVGQSLLKTIFGTNAKQWENCFPLKYVDDNVCPTLLLNAEFEFGLKGSAQQLYEALCKHQIWTEQHCYRALTHFSIISDWDGAYENILNTIVSFCRRVQSGQWPNLAHF